jgi:hypothetical protein
LDEHSILNYDHDRENTIKGLNERLKTQEDSMAELMEAIELNKKELTNLVRNKALRSVKTVLEKK